MEPQSFFFNLIFYEREMPERSRTVSVSIKATQPQQILAWSIRSAFKIPWQKIFKQRNALKDFFRGEIYAITVTHLLHELFTFLCRPSSLQLLPRLAMFFSRLHLERIKGNTWTDPSGQYWFIPFKEIARAFINIPGL